LMLGEDGTPILTGFEETIDDIITPSPWCKKVVDIFGSAVSNFTQCSVQNARPIHLCQWCIMHYLQVTKAKEDLTESVDEKTGKKCGEYFTNLDRLEIVNGAYEYVNNLWSKGKCKYCFNKNLNGTIAPSITEDLTNFNYNYELVKACFGETLASNTTNETCTKCRGLYDNFNNFSLFLMERDGDNVCLDVVDTMNSTRDVWSRVFTCVPSRKEEFWLPVSMSVVAVIPIVFYFLAFLFSNVQEANVLHQSRLLGAALHNGSYGSASFSGSNIPGNREASTSVDGVRDGNSVAATAGSVRSSVMS